VRGRAPRGSYVTKNNDSQDCGCGRLAAAGGDRSLQALGETGLSAAELGRPMGRGREYCVIKCAAVEIVGRGKGKGVTQGSVTCPLYIFGLGLGCDASDAWNAAHDAVNYNVPPGCQKRHCHGIAGACKNWEGGRRGN